MADFTKTNTHLLGAANGRELETARNVLRAYGVLDEKSGLARRSYVIVDKAGIVRYKHVPQSGAPKFLLSTETLLNEVRKVNKGS